MLFGKAFAAQNRIDEETFVNQFLSMAMASCSNTFTGVTPAFFEPQREMLAAQLKQLL